MCLAVLAAIYTIWCIERLARNVLIPGNLDQKFVPELMAYSIFWVLAPPMWFFLEYFAAESDCISDLPRSDGNLKIIKDYADYASKVWAGVLALLAALIALKTNR
jgi:hypothetical protein